MDERFLPYSPSRDIYRLLGVDPRADAASVVAACRELARRLHPDRNRSPRATEEMQVINGVRRLMTDPAERARYDLARRRWWAAVAVNGRRAIGVPVSGPLAPSSETLRLPARSLDGFGRRISRVSRRLRAFGVGLRAGLAALAPARCAACRTVLGPDERWCDVCGLPARGEERAA
jgi:curved DNA-binding protein CbpA